MKARHEECFARSNVTPKCIFPAGKYRQVPSFVWFRMEDATLAPNLMTLKGKGKSCCTHELLQKCTSSFTCNRDRERTVRTYQQKSKLHWENKSKFHVLADPVTGAAQCNTWVNTEDLQTWRQQKNLQMSWVLSVVHSLPYILVWIKP